MKITPLASSSAGNAYLIESEETRLLIDCGIPTSDLMQRLKFNLPDLCLVTHSHKDHSGAVQDLIHRGIDIRMSQECANEIGAGNRVGIIEHNDVFTYNDLVIQPFEMPHDVPCLGFYITEIGTRERLFFATDCSHIPYKLPPTDYLMVECNHDKDLLYHGELTPEYEAANKRLAKSHMSIQNLLFWLSMTDLSKTKRIYLLHLSNGNSNEQDFKRRVMEATGCPVTVC